MRPPLAFRVLGPLEVTTSAGPGAAGTAVGDERARLLLCRLLVAPGQVVAAGRLAADVGVGDVDALAGAVAAVRAALGDGDGVLVASAPEGYRLAVRPDAVDAARFERDVADARSAVAPGGAALSRALAAFDAGLGLWRGPAFADVAGRDWAAPEASRLDDLRAAAVEDRADVLLALGRHADLVAELEAAVADEPLRERRARQLAVALYRSGREDEALAALERVRGDLFDQLSVAPTGALVELEHGIRRRHPALNPPRQQST